MEAFEEYVALYDFKSDADSEVELAVNDVIEVATAHVNKDPSGWVKGKNKRTGVEGFYPGKFFFIFYFFLPSAFILHAHV